MLFSCAIPLLSIHDPVCAICNNFYGHSYCKVDDTHDCRICVLYLCAMYTTEFLINFKL